MNIGNIQVYKNTCGFFKAFLTENKVQCPPNIMGQVSTTVDTQV